MADEQWVSSGRILLGARESLCWTIGQRLFGSACEGAQRRSEMNTGPQTVAGRVFRLMGPRAAAVSGCGEGG
jgi:hypothetical protein